MKLFLATGNRGKLADFSALVPQADWDLLPGFASLPSVEETGASFEANARLKAEHYSRWCSGWVLADDSGLAVTALGGEPGIYSARYAGRHGDDHANNQLLLQRLEQVGAADRGAEFICVLALARAGHTAATFTGRAQGVILPKAQGRGGFGYDPLFYSPAAGCSFAELNPAEKARFSHRGQAARTLLEWMESSPEWREIRHEYDQDENDQARR